MLEETIRVSQYPDSLFFYSHSELVSESLTICHSELVSESKKKGNKWHGKGAKVIMIQC